MSRRPSDARDAWLSATAALAAAQRALHTAPAGIARQAPYAVLLTARRDCAAVIHGWLAAAVSPAAVERAVQVVVVGDGVLFDEAAVLPSVSLAGAIAVRVLQLAGVSVVVVTAASIAPVEDVVRRFTLPAAIAEHAVTVLPGATPAVPRLADRVAEQLDRLRTTLRSDEDVVLDPDRTCSIRASRIVDGEAQPVRGAHARALLETMRLTDLTFRVTPRHTDFVGRDVNPLAALRDALSGRGLDALPVAAIAASRADCAIPADAATVFVPLGAPPSYRTLRGRQVVSAGYEPDDALWAAVWHLLPDAGVRQQAAEMLAAIAWPDWLPGALGRRPALDARPLANAGHHWPPAAQQRTPTPTG